MGKRRTRITDIEVDEISIVDKAANGKRFLLYKRGEKAPESAASDAGTVAAAVSADLASLVKAENSPARRVHYDEGAVNRMLDFGPGLGA